MKAKYPPVIVIGSSRSGTSILTMLLQKLGLFVGWKTDNHYESLFFQRLNRWLLAIAGGNIENPFPIKHLFENTKARNLIADYLTAYLKTPRCLEYLGWTRYLRYRTVFNLNIPWGWKDPRNTFTLPLWLQIFGDAKVIHIIRHGVDVADSLVRRQQKTLNSLENKYLKYGQKYWYYHSMVRDFTKTGFADIRCHNLERAFAIWLEYVEEARNHLKSLRDRAIQVKYEDLIDNPKEMLSMLADFVGLAKPSNTLIENIINLIDKDKKFVYQTDSHLMEFAKQKQDILKRFGY